MRVMARRWLGFQPKPHRDIRNVVAVTCRCSGMIAWYSRDKLGHSVAPSWQEIRNAISRRDVKHFGCQLKTAAQGMIRWTTLSSLPTRLCGCTRDLFAFVDWLAL